MTTRFPRALHLRTTCFNESFCTSIAVAITMSAHSISDACKLRTLRSTSRRSQEGGSNAETVSSPSGGNAHRFPSNGSAWRKLQYVSGNSGLTNKTFMTSPSLLLTKTNPPGKRFTNRFVICREDDFQQSLWHAQGEAHRRFLFPWLRPSLNTSPG